MGVFVPKEDANEILGAITSRLVGGPQATASRASRRGSSSWSTTSAPKASASASRRSSARTLEDYTLPPIAVEPSHHLGVHPQKQEGLSYIGVPVHLGLVSGDQMIAIADLAERYGGDIRLTRQQNFIVTGVPNESVDEVVAELERIGFPLDINPVRGNSIACTGEPHCNFSVAETKTRLGRLIDNLEERFGDADRRRCGCTSTAARTPAPSTGSATSASRARPRATRAACGGRPTTSSCAAASGPSPRSASRSSGACRPTSSTPPSRG